MVKTVNVTLWEIYHNRFEKGNSNEGSITVQGHVGECCSVCREGGFSCTEIAVERCLPRGSALCQLWAATPILRPPHTQPVCIRLPTRRGSTLLDKDPFFPVARRS